MAKRIPLTQGKFALVDDDMHPFLNRHKWYCSHGYAARMERRHGRRRVMMMHHRILPQRVDCDVDHINGNTLDNRRVNLRYATRSQNNANRHARSKGSSSYKGVCWRPIPRRWKAYIKKDGQQIHLGYFSTQEDAARAYNKAALRLFGEYARLNEVR